MTYIQLQHPEMNLLWSKKRIYWEFKTRHKRHQATPPLFKYYFSNLGGGVVQNLGKPADVIPLCIKQIEPKMHVSDLNVQFWYQMIVLKY